MDGEKNIEEIVFEPIIKKKPKKRKINNEFFNYMFESKLYYEEFLKDVEFQENLKKTFKVNFIFSIQNFSNNILTLDLTEGEYLSKDDLIANLESFEFSIEKKFSSKKIICNSEENKSLLKNIKKLVEIDYLNKVKFKTCENNFEFIDIEKEITVDQKYALKLVCFKKFNPNFFIDNDYIVLNIDKNFIFCDYFGNSLFNDVLFKKKLKEKKNKLNKGLNEIQIDYLSKKYILILFCLEISILKNNEFDCYFDEIFSFYQMKNVFSNIFLIIPMINEINFIESLLIYLQKIDKNEKSLFLSYPSKIYLIFEKSQKKIIFEKFDLIQTTKKIIELQENTPKKYGFFLFTFNIFFMNYYYT